MMVACVQWSLDAGDDATVKSLKGSAPGVRALMFVNASALTCVHEVCPRAQLTGLELSSTTSYSSLLQGTKCEEGGLSE